MRPCPVRGRLSSHCLCLCHQPYPALSLGLTAAGPAEVPCTQTGKWTTTLRVPRHCVFLSNPEMRAWSGWGEGKVQVSLTGTRGPRTLCGVWFLYCTAAQVGSRSHLGLAALCTPRGSGQGWQGRGASADSGRWWAHRDTTGATLLPARACHDTRHCGARQVRPSARSKHSAREQGRSSWGVPDTGSPLTGEHRGAVCTEATRPASGPFCRGADRLCGLGSRPGKRPLQHPVTGAVALWVLVSCRGQVVALASKALGERGLRWDVGWPPAVLGPCEAV